MQDLKERLTEVMAAKGWEHADVVRISGQSSSVVSQWLGKSSKVIKTIGKLEAAQRLAAVSGYEALWIAKGMGAKLSPTVTQDSAAPFSGDVMARLIAQPASARAWIESVVSLLLDAPGARQKNVLSFTRRSE